MDVWLLRIRRDISAIEVPHLRSERPQSHTRLPTPEYWCLEEEPLCVVEKNRRDSYFLGEKE